MTFDQFHNGLRVLLNIDSDEFAHAAYGYEGSYRSMPGDVHRDWVEFHDDPFKWFIRAPDAKARAIWKIVAERTEGAEV